MARKFSIVVEGVPDEYNAEAIKAMLNLGLRKVTSSRLAMSFVPKVARPVIAKLDIKYMEEAVRQQNSLVTD